VATSDGGARTLRLTFLEQIRRSVPFDAHAWVLTDPETAVGSSPLADVPFLPELPRLIRLKYLTEVNRWTHLAEPAALLTEATRGDLDRSRVWRELLSRHRVTDVASAVFRDEFGTWGFLELWRIAPSRPFTPADREHLAGLAGRVTRALRRSQADTFLAPSGHEPDRRGPVVLMLSETLEVLAQTSETAEYLRILVPPGPGNDPVPAGAYNVAAQLLAVEAGIDANPPWARVHLAEGRWLTLRAARLARDIAVTIEDSSPSERSALYARAHGLSRRESELLDHLVRGRDTEELARLMFLSRHTVQDHLKSIFAKAAVHSRRALLARVVGSA
jgi:DNA-binding CsgD family transcriptional regulator